MALQECPDIRAALQQPAVTIVDGSVPTSCAAPASIAFRPFGGVAHGGRRLALPSKIKQHSDRSQEQTSTHSQQRGGMPHRRWRRHKLVAP